MTRWTRHALVIGNGAYAGSPLRNPTNDARAVASQLQKLGFGGMLRANLTKRDLDGAVREFLPRLRSEDIALVFFAGHGLQFEGASYLLPVDASITMSSDVPYEAYPAQRLVDSIAATGVRLSVLVLDACRAGAVRGFRSPYADGLAPLSASAFRGSRRGSQDYAIVYATEPGSVAADSLGGENSPFTKAFVASLEVPGLSLDEVMHRTTAEVHRHTGYGQRPVAQMSLTGRHVLNAPASEGPDASPTMVNPSRPRPSSADDGDPLSARNGEGLTERVNATLDALMSLRTDLERELERVAPHFARDDVRSNVPSSDPHVPDFHVQPAAWAMGLATAWRRGVDVELCGAMLSLVDERAISRIQRLLPDGMRRAIEKLGVLTTRLPSHGVALHLRDAWASERRAQIVDLLGLPEEEALEAVMNHVPIDARLAMKIAVLRNHGGDRTLEIIKDTLEDSDAASLEHILALLPEALAAELREVL